MSNETQYPIHFKLQVWAADKETGEIPAFIISSLRFFPEQTKDLKADGEFQKAYTEYREFVKRNNPKIKFVSEG